jgi:hypothetical protein
MGAGRQYTCRPALIPGRAMPKMGALGKQLEAAMNCEDEAVRLREAETLRAMQPDVLQIGVCLR